MDAWKGRSGVWGNMGMAPPQWSQWEQEGRARRQITFASIARGLKRDVHYDVDEEKRIVAPTEAGVHEVERARLATTRDLVAERRSRAAATLRERQATEQTAIGSLKPFRVIDRCSEAANCGRPVMSRLPSRTLPLTVVSLRLRPPLPITN